MSRTTIGVLALSCAVVPALALAEHPQERKGFWFGAGAGYGSADAHCDVCNGGERAGGPTLSLRLGGTLSEHILLGGELNFWTKEQEGVTLNLYNYSGTVTFYPRASSGFFIKGGAGLSSIDTEVRQGTTVTTRNIGTGLGVIAGAGYDLRVSRKISITPALDFLYGNQGPTFEIGLAPPGPDLSWKYNVLGLSIGVTFH
jgi:hypothetical protein